MYLRTHSYKKRKRRGATLFIVLIFLFVLACTLYFFLSEQLVFSNEGFHFSFSDDKPAPPLVTDDVKPPVIIENPSTSVPDEPIKPPVIDIITASVTNAKTIPTKELSNTSYIDGLIAQGVKDIAFYAKGDDGVLNIGGTYSTDVSSGVLSPVWLENEAGLKKLKDSGVKITAIISVLRDNKMPRTNKLDAVKTNGTTWLDYNMHSWFDPNSALAITYTNEIILQCEKLGVGEIVLHNMCYPQRGKLNLLDAAYKPNTLNIEALANAISSNVTLSLWLNDRAAAANTAQNVAPLSGAFSKLYIESTPDTELSTATASVLNGDCTLGYIVQDEAVITQRKDINYIVK